MKIKSILGQVGLTGNEAKIYLALLELGSALAGELTKRSGVNRTNVYDALDRLIEKGLVSYVVKANRKYFEATPPDRILRYLDEIQNELKKKKKMVNSIIPELEVKRKLGKQPQEATIYKGRKGLKSITEDILKEKKHMFVFGAQGNFISLFPHYGNHWHVRRGKLKIPVTVIYNEKVRSQKIKANWKYFEMRFNSNLYDTPSTTWIYGDKVAIVIWLNQPIITLIRSKEVAKSYKQFFNVLWNNSKK